MFFLIAKSFDRLCDEMNIIGISETKQIIIGLLLAILITLELFIIPDIMLYKKDPLCFNESFDYICR